MGISIENIFAKRKQVRKFSDEIPDRNLINKLIKKTFDTVPSKQNLMPYTVHVLGPEHVEAKDKFYKITCHEGTTSNTNVLAPYVLFFTSRLVFPTEALFRRQNATSIPLGKGHPMCDINRYKNTTQLRETNIEIGMFSAILSGLCIEQGLDVAYLLCMDENQLNDHDDFKYLHNEVILFSMQIGVAPRSAKKNYYREDKPDYDEVVSWV